MFDLPFAGILPKSLIAGAVIFGGVHYFAIAPVIASRVVAVDHLPTCTADIKSTAIAAAKRRAEELPSPKSDPGRDIAAKQLRRLMDNPLMRELNDMGGLGDVLGLGETTDLLLGDYERGRQAAQEAYQSSVERLKSETATNLAQAGSVCGCLADAAISDTRTQWAIFTGTFGLIRPAPLVDFGRRMSELYGAGRCAIVQKVAP